MFLAIDSVLQAAPHGTDLSGYDRLGLSLNQTPPTHQLQVGNFAFVFIDEPEAGSMLRQAWDSVRPSGRTSLALTLTVENLDAIPNGIRGKLADGRDAVLLPIEESAGAHLVLVSEGRKSAEQMHPFPLRRLDHLAIVTHDLEARCRYWERDLATPITGEVVTPTMVIRQIRVGDAVIELLGPVGADSPLWKRIPGLISMASWEVANVDAAVAQARAAGFDVADAALGVLPGTRIATVPGTALAGINMQLLQYV
ncbi:MAG: VOC family protein [Gemmataceae bacterium]